MKNKATKTVNTAKTTKLKNLVQLPKQQLETIVGGSQDADPPTSRGTETSSRYP
jgi:hypothetical protein